MKKSELRHIIRESIKELLTEQTNQFPHGGNCSNRTLIPGFVGGFNVIDTINQNYGPNANWIDYVHEEPDSPANIQYYANNTSFCIASPTTLYTSYSHIHSINQPSWCGFNYVYNFQQLIDGLNNAQNSPGTFTTSMTYSQARTLAINSGIGACLPSNYVGSHCMNCQMDYGFNCKQIGDHPKFGSKCVPGTSQNPGTFTTLQDCLDSGCEPKSPDVDIDAETEPAGPSITPFTTDPQDMVKPEKDKIDRMQELANIKR